MGVFDLLQHRFFKSPSLNSNQFLHDFPVKLVELHVGELYPLVAIGINGVPDSTNGLDQVIDLGPLGWVEHQSLLENAVEVVAVVQGVLLGVEYALKFVQYLGIEGGLLFVELGPVEVEHVGRDFFVGLLVLEAEGFVFDELHEVALESLLADFEDKDGHDERVDVLLRGGDGSFVFESLGGAKELDGALEDLSETAGLVEVDEPQVLLLIFVLD